MLLFGNNFNKFTYNNNFGSLKKIFVFTPIGEGINKFQYKSACIVLSFYHKFNSYLYYSGYNELCIILTKGIVIFRN